jgi:nucleoside-diphosphate-sugar epimerase
MNKEYVLITGATGFIGSHVTEKFLSDESYRIVAIVRSKKNYKNVEELENKGAILVEGNFYDNNLLEKLFEEFPIQNVIHIAALRGGGAGTREDYYEVNVCGTEVLLEASFKNQIKKFIFCSSVGVYGTIPKELPANIMTELNGDNEYHKSKILAEKKVQEFINRGLDAYIVRPTITYGLGDQGFPKTLVELVIKRVFLLPFKDIKIHLLDMCNLAELLSQMVKSDGLNQRVFIAADEAPISLKELVNLIHFHYNKSKYPSFLKLPTPIFKILSLFFKLSRNEKWLTRILLVSKSWHYDIDETMNAFQYVPTRTEDSFIKSMRI